MTFTITQESKTKNDHIYVPQDYANESFGVSSLSLLHTQNHKLYHFDVTYVTKRDKLDLHVSCQFIFLIWTYGM